MKIADLKQKDTGDLAKAIDELRKEQFNLRFQKSSDQLTNTARIRQVRRTIARAKTLLADKTRNKKD